jgi:hypothetical protein
MKKLSILMILAIYAALSACQSSPPAKHLLNTDASLPAKHSIADKGLRVIASFINKKEQTMSTLYGNTAAFNQLKDGAKPVAGQELTLITWLQKDDPHWFGARIPGKVSLIETIKIEAVAGNTTVNYQKFKGADLIADADTTGNAGRIAFMLSQQPLVTP